MELRPQEDAEWNLDDVAQDIDFHAIVPGHLHYFGEKPGRLRQLLREVEHDDAAAGASEKFQGNRTPPVCRHGQYGPKTPAESKSAERNLVNPITGILPDVNSQEKEKLVEQHITGQRRN